MEGTLHKSRFCYSYTPSCQSVNECYKISTMNTTEGSLLLSSQFKCYKDNYNTRVNSTITYTNNNISTIRDTLFGQLVQIKNDRYQPYQPYIPTIIPPSVMQLQMKSVNVGVPHSIITTSDCKDSQTVTTSTRIIY